MPSLSCAANAKSFYTLLFQRFRECFRDQLGSGNDRTDNDTEHSQFHNPFCLLRGIDIPFRDHSVLRLRNDLPDDLKIILLYTGMEKMIGVLFIVSA